MKIPRLIVSGATSGVGKTSITCGIIFGLKKQGYSIQPFKVGPDYIDPSYLSSVAKNNTRNLDVWIMGKEELVKSFVNHSKSDISIIEGVMGYYDGFSGASNYSSTHHVATILDTPVILVLDASKTARSLGAIALGYKKFHKNSHIVGIILNKIASKKHENLCRQSLESLKIPIIGIIPKDEKLSLPSRHLGLIPTKEDKTIRTKIIKIAKEISSYIDIQKLITVSENTSHITIPKIFKHKKTKTSIAVALDDSFNFYYQDNLDALRREGVRLKFFSPTSDTKLPKCDGIYIGGGFPEVLGDKLSKNYQIKKLIKKAAVDEIPIYAECGGLMYLTNSISYDNKKFKMIGVFDAETIMTKKMKLNYTKGKITSNCLIGPKNSIFQGHEFHYSEIDSLSSDSKFAYSLSIGDGIKNKKDGLINYNTLASYGHLYFDSSSFAQNFANISLAYSRR
ncbi:MAG: cobyrinate a,c-diamide synthase [Crenarchaeota archaeon]|nr:MAG: cobyrinate a,c-diamide synthase [Thermoproteota archaeon]RDJ33471.1 MAG: cobyrinate a,c-diamide synthase [Thermoproteota archaeon]RDJ36543.1 MAG: cobyrinate a,c-diamide synthase [Thermoproteota archaeon]RDJ39268.1 MAG: cobyrinate a,c-diamide synthase [Thermoproteota archaeon]